MSNRPKLYYFADPMCSWCYGFAPVMDQIIATYSHRFDIRLVMGGLRPGKLAQVTTPAVARVMRHHWREVAKMTGQVFDERFFEREGFVYDTEPAAKAVVVMERLAPASAYAYYHEIQSAFYAKNQDITSGDILATAAEPHGVSRENFLAALQSEQVHKETWGQFTFSGSLGIRGFPSLVLEENDQFMLLTRGYQSFDQIEKIFEKLDGPAEGESCEVGGEC